MQPHYIQCAFYKKIHFKGTACVHIYYKQNSFSQHNLRNYLYTQQILSFYNKTKQTHAHTHIRNVCAHTNTSWTQTLYYCNYPKYLTAPNIRPQCIFQEFSQKKLLNIRPPPENVMSSNIRPPPENVVSSNIQPPPKNVMSSNIRPPPKLRLKYSFKAQRV